MLMLALKPIPGTIQIAPGQQFHELDPDRAEMWLRDGLATKVIHMTTATSTGGLQWEGCEVLIIASGPSLDEEQVAAALKWRDAKRLRRRVIVINTTFRLAPWADVLYACDARWWEVYYAEALGNFAGELWSQTEGSRPFDFPDVRLIKSQRGNGLNKRQATINTGMHSGYQAINLAWQAGARQIYLLGYDLREIGGQTHWHGEHPKPLRAKNQFAAWQGCYKQLAADLSADTEVVNITPGSALKVFPLKDWKEVLA